jgi:hypothetical protein
VSASYGWLRGTSKNSRSHRQHLGPRRHRPGRQKREIARSLGQRIVVENVVGAARKDFRFGDGGRARASSVVRRAGGRARRHRSDRQKAALVIMRVPLRQPLVAVHDVDRVVDVQHHRPRRLRVAPAPDVDERRTVKATFASPFATSPRAANDRQWRAAGDWMAGLSLDGWFPRRCGSCFSRAAISKPLFRSGDLVNDFGIFGERDTSKVQSARKLSPIE